MIVLRLRRIGKKHQASYRVVVSERREKLQAPPTEDLGWYNPHNKKSEFKAERIKYWLSVGAKASPTVHNLLVNAKIIEGKKIAVHNQPKKSEAMTNDGMPNDKIKAEAAAKDGQAAKPAPEAAKPIPEAGKPAPEVAPAA